MDPNLYKAAMKGNMELLTSFQGVLKCCLTPQKNTVLHIAVEFGHQNIVEEVMQGCPSLILRQNSKGDTPLHVAARAGRLDLTKSLTTEGNPDLKRVDIEQQFGGRALTKRNLEGSNPIHEALKKSHEKVALHLLAFKVEYHELARGLVCDENNSSESLLYLAAEAGLDEVVQKIIDIGNYSTSGPDGQNPLHIAVIKGRLGVVKILLHKARYLIKGVDGSGNTVLHYASGTGYCRVLEDEGKDEYKYKDMYLERVRTERQHRIEILKLLLEADKSLAYVPNRNGDYPLFIAIRNDFAVGTILDHLPDTAELVNQKGQNAFHLAAIEKNYVIHWNLLINRLEFKKLINEPDNDGNTPMHLATLNKRDDIVKLLIDKGGPDLTMSNKEGITAMDLCGYTETEHPILVTLRESGAVPSRHRWQEWIPIPPPLSRIKKLKISPEFKKLGLQTLPIVTSLVATVTFAAAFTVPGGYKNDGPREGLPVFMRNAALQAFVLSDILAFCSSMAATVLLVYANAHAEDAFKIYCVIHTCYYI